MIYITSDLHFGHEREFLYGPRGFTTISEHDQKIIENWNSIVKDDDIVYVLGDIMLNDNINGRKCWNQLRGEKHVIWGNHDSDVRKEILAECHNTYLDGYSMPFKYKHYNFYLSHYPSIVSNYDADKPLRARVINLCGHSHTQDKFKDFDKGLIYHVELDAHNNTPVSIDQIIKDIKERIG